jgi:hypothetical protein
MTTATLSCSTLPAVTDLIASKTNWLAADLAASSFGGPDGSLGVTLNATAANVNYFDGTPYRNLLLYWFGTFANGVTLELDVLHYTDSDVTSGSIVGATKVTSASSGSPVVIYTGANANADAATTDNTFSATHTCTVIRYGLR